MLTELKAGHTGSDIWLANQFIHKHLVSWSPLRDKEGATLGAIVMMWSISDQRAASLSSGAVALVVIEGGVPKVRARANDGGVSNFTTDLEGASKDLVINALKTGREAQVGTGIATGVAALSSVGDGTKAAVAVARRVATIQSPDSVVWPVLAASGLGVIFVVIAGFLLAGYVNEPINKMEEVLLAVINGNTNQRVEIQHEEFGGLAFRINQLLKHGFWALKKTRRMTKGARQ